MRTEYKTIKISLQDESAVLTIDNPRSIPCLRNRNGT